MLRSSTLQEYKHYPQNSPYGEDKGRRESQATMENISAVNQTLNSSEFQSVLGAGGHFALNVISMLLLGLPMVLSNGFVIIVLLMDKTTISALRIALINILVAVMTTGLTFILWVIAHIARRAGLASDQSLVLAIRIAAGFFQASFFLRSIALSVLAVVVYVVVKKGPPKKNGTWCLSAVVVGMSALAVIYSSLEASDMAFGFAVYLDGYHVFLVFSHFGKYWALGTGIIVEIPSKTVTLTFAVLAFRHVKRNVSVTVETGMRKAMLKFLITTMVLNAIITFLNLSFSVSVFLDNADSLNQNSSGVLALNYIGQIVTALSTILIPIILTVQFRSVSTTVKERFGCGKVTPTIHPGST